MYMRGEYILANCFVVHTYSTFADLSSVTVSVLRTPKPRPRQRQAAHCSRQEVPRSSKLQYAIPTEGGTPGE